ncbi:MAG: glycosyltransferase family 2 protein [Desulfatirhabdiaceae bacterium]
MVEREPLVTIGIPTYNRANLVGNAIESALKQDYVNIELIVSDNASNDVTETICKKYSMIDPRIKYFKQTKNIGMTFNFAEVLKKASGSFFMWLGDDDWIDSNYVSTTLLAFKRDQTIALASGTPMYYRNGEKVNTGKVFELIHDSWWRRVIAYYWQVADNGMFYGLMRTSDIMQQLPFRNAMGEDWLIVARIACLGKIIVFKETAIHRGLDGASISGRNIASISGLSALHGEFPFVFASIHAMLDIITGNSSFKDYPINQRLIVGIAVFLIILIQTKLKYFPTLRRVLMHLFEGIRLRNI